MSRPLTPDEITHLNSLTPLARLKRRQHGPTDPHTLASAELTALFKKLNEDDVTITELAKATNLRYHSVRARIKKDTA